MALAFAYRSSVYSTTAATSYTCAPTYTPAAGSLLVAFVVTTLGATPLDPTTVTGHGVSFSKLTLTARTLSTTHAVSVWIANAGVSPTSVACIASYGAVSQTGGTVTEFEVTGADLTTLAGSIVQNPTNTGSGTSGSVVLAAAGSADNRPMSFWLHLANEATTAQSLWTLTAGATGNFNTPATGAAGQFRTDAYETPATATWTGNVAWRGVAIEVKALGPVARPLRQVNQAVNRASTF
jgi:predicted aconitase with swiveling domain